MGSYLDMAALDAILQEHTTIFLGIDPGKTTGVALLDASGCLLAQGACKLPDSMLFLRSIELFLHKKVIVASELLPDIHGYRNTQEVLQSTAVIFGSLAYFATDRGCSTFLMAATTARHEVMGNRYAKSPAIAAWVHFNKGITRCSAHVCDAIIIAEAARLRRKNS